MTERKPAGIRWESWIDRQIREAQERGEFDDLPGYGKPIPDLDRPHDDLWWVKDKLRRERLSWLPPTLALRKEAEDFVERLGRQPSEAAVRRRVSELNGKIAEVNASAMTGPPARLAPFDADVLVERWRAARQEATQGCREPAAPGKSGGRANPRWRWTRRWRRDSAGSLRG